MNEKDKKPILYLQPDNEENYDFLLHLYFGYDSDVLNSILQRAYMDFSRTIRGINSHTGREDISKECRGVLRWELKIEVIKNQSQESFDIWHENLCVRLKEIYHKNGFSDFHIGQAQKWINMALKYVFLHPNLADNYKYIYKFCHIPIDNIIIENLAKIGIPNLLGSKEAWSRLDDYKRYLDYQITIRNYYQDSFPLAVEFKLWQSKS